MKYRDQPLTYNPEEHECIERCPHDEDNPYTQILNELIRAEELSPNCRWMLIYLLSNKKGWKVNIKQIASHVKEHNGIKKVYDWIDEAIEKGYMKRIQLFEGNLRRGIRYVISEKPKFKIAVSLDDSKNVSDTAISATPSTGIPKTATHKKEHLKEEHIQEVIIAQMEKSDQSQESYKPAGGNNNSFYDCLKKCNDLTNKQKITLSTHSEPLVELAVKYCYHHTTQIEGGSVGRIKMLQYVIRNMEDFTITIQNLDKPKPSPEEKGKVKWNECQEIVFSNFKLGYSYNGCKFFYDDNATGFIHNELGFRYVKWNDPDFINKWELLLKLLKMK